MAETEKMKKMKKRKKKIKSGGRKRRRAYLPTEGTGIANGQERLVVKRCNSWGVPSDTGYTHGKKVWAMRRHMGIHRGVQYFITTLAQ